MPSLDLSILNQRQTPAFYADILANRPAAGFIGRIFVSTDTYAFYRDNGTSWDLIGGPGTGTVTGTGTTGQVTYWNGASTITGSNNLFWDTANNRLGINNTTPGASIDVHSAVSSIAQFNQTVATNNSLLVLQNSGSALWRLGNFYNAAANDFGVFDVIGAIQPLTIKKTSGQVLIGTSTVGSGKLVVASASSDNGVQIVGASAPSLRIDNAESGPTKRAGLGISTATNNFIQGSADRDFCIFNGSTAAASPILFGVYDAGAVNVQEAARISAARNFLIGTTTDGGQKLQVNGTSSFNNTVTAAANFILSGNTNSFATASIFRNANRIFFGGDTGGYYFQNSANSSTLLTILDSGAATFSSSVTTGGNILVPAGSGLAWSGGATRIMTPEDNVSGALIQTPGITRLINNGVETARFTSSNNLLIGTTTDNGNKLQVSGNAFISGNINSLGINSAPTSTTTSANYIQFRNTGGDFYIGQEGSTNGGFFTGSTAYASVFYGATVQQFIINGVLRMQIKTTGILNLINTPIYASNALALAGGLVAGDIYKSATGVLSIVY